LPGKKFTSDNSNGDVTISGSGENGKSTSDCVWSDSDFTQDERDGDVLNTAYIYKKKNKKKYNQFSKKNV
jgi:hypothetical protein